MKAVLEFDMNEPDDRFEHLRALKARDMALALWEIDQKFRSFEKYEGQPEITRDTIREILLDNNINLDEINQ